MASDKPYPLACVGALVQSPSGRVLIVKTTKWTGLWGVPGGKIDWGETAEAAVLREFREEVGLDLHSVVFAQIQDCVLSPEFHKPAHFILIDFFAQSYSEAITPNQEIVEWAWVEAREALSYPLNAVTQTLVQKYLSQPKPPLGAGQVSGWPEKPSGQRGQ
jgi:ADP-ribose pyrophosphatase YjhB (NUDIX family)